MSIPPIFVKTSREKPQQYVVDMIQRNIPGWTYEHYNYTKIIQFFRQNPIQATRFIVT
jgi:hypothetical protein